MPTVLLAVLCLAATAIAGASAHTRTGVAPLRPSFTPHDLFGSPLFSFAHDLVVCVIQKPSTDPATPAYVRCDGKGSRGNSTEPLVGGNQALLAHATAACGAAARKSGYGASIEGLILPASGPGRPNCVGDAIDPYPDGKMPVGAAVRAFGFACTLARNGLTCSRGSHGFFYGNDHTWRVH